MHMRPVNSPMQIRVDNLLHALRYIGTLVMTKKRDRQGTMLRLIGSNRIASQEDLRRLLAAEGWNVTQATLSRDLRDLGVMRAPGDDGARYMLPEMVVDEAKPSLDGLLPQLFSTDRWSRRADRPAHPSERSPADRRSHRCPGLVRDHWHPRRREHDPHRLPLRCRPRDAHQAPGLDWPDENSAAEVRSH